MTLFRYLKALTMISCINIRHHNITSMLLKYCNTRQLQLDFVCFVMDLVDFYIFPWVIGALNFVDFDV